MIANLLNAIYNEVNEQGTDHQVALNVNPMTPENYPYFEEDMKYVQEALKWGGYNGPAINPLSMVEVYVDRDNDGEADYLIITDSNGDHLFRCGWGCPATLNHIKVEG